MVFPQLTIHTHLIFPRLRVNVLVSGEEPLLVRWILIKTPLGKPQRLLVKLLLLLLNNKPYGPSLICSKSQWPSFTYLCFNCLTVVYSNNVCCNCKTKFLFQEIYLHSALLKKLRYFFTIVNQSRKKKQFVHGRIAVI